MSELAVFEALLRSDFCSFYRKCFHTVVSGTEFVANWHVKAIAHCLFQVQHGEITRLVINVPPRSGKSIAVSVAYVAWILGHNPTRRVIVVSYSNDLAADLHRQFRMVVVSEWYQRLFPNMRLAKDTELEAVTTLGGCRYATSVTGTLTGRGADLIIIDEPHKAEDAQSEKALAKIRDWYSGTLVSRLDNKQTGQIIVAMQRLHPDDLSGCVLEKGDCTHLKLAARATDNQIIPLGNGELKHWRAGEALQPQREGIEVLEKVQRESGTPYFNAQYQQDPAPKCGNMIQRQWLRWHELAPLKQRGDQIVQSWDVAIGTDDHNAYSVGITCLKRADIFYVLDVTRVRLSFPDLLRKIRSQARDYAANVILIEKAGIGEALLQQLETSPPSATVIGILPRGNKKDRLAAQSAKLEAGNLSLPSEAPWLADFLAEVLAFPNTTYADQIDSLSQLLHWSSRRSIEPPTYPSLPIYGD